VAIQYLSLGSYLPFEADVTRNVLLKIYSNGYPEFLRVGCKVTSEVIGVFE